MNTSAFGVEKGVLLKLPATANLMIDSADRDETRYPAYSDFQITRSQPLINGFFTRIGATEVVWDYCEYNVPTGFPYVDGSMNKIWLDISGTGANSFNGVAGFSIPPGVYTIGDCLDALKASINAGTATTGVSATISTTTAPGWTSLDLSGGVASVVNLNVSPGGYFLGTRLGLTTFFGEPSSVFILDCPDLRLSRYYDIVCESLTAVQDVQDAATSTTDRNVLVRWYMCEDVPENLDQYGFPILMGYEQFHRRRLYNPPKQIKWEQNLQLGSLSFRVFDDTGRLVIPTGVIADNRTNFLLTLQLSEG